MPRESAIVSRTRELFKKLEPTSHFMKTSGDGEPDLVGVIRGRSTVCECKQPGEKPEPLQYVRLRQWAFGGAWALWTNGERFYQVFEDGTEQDIAAAK